MTLEQIVQSTKTFLMEVKAADKKLQALPSKNVNSQEERDAYERLASRWFCDYSKVLPVYGVPAEVISKYSDAFKNMLKLTTGPNRRASFAKLFDVVTQNFNNDIIIFLQTEADEPVPDTHVELERGAQELLAKIPDKDENEYLLEAIGCWQSDFLRGATVLLWCAAIDRIHKVIKQIGFDVFNRTSTYMKGQPSGKFKRFNKEYNVQSLSDLRTVFDSDILWILEGMELIDSNERARLASCFDMRCHSGHPGAAPITKYNVLSCFSDIVEIVLANPLFALHEATTD